jgi:hypothetical protein
MVRVMAEFEVKMRDLFGIRVGLGEIFRVGGGKWGVRWGNVGGWGGRWWGLRG